MKYPLASDTWDEREIEAIQKVIESGRYTMGPKVEEFEEAFSKKFGVKHAVMTNSGSSANLLMLAAMMHAGIISPGDEIIVPAVSWSTTYFPVHQLGLKLVFVDVFANTMNIDTNKVEDAISERTIAVFTVNLLGTPSDLTVLKRLCKKYDLFLLEDNCESLGATHYGDYCGTLGFAGTFSFFFSHHMQTMEGGMVVTDDPYMADIVRSMRAHGWTRDLKTDILAAKTGDPFVDSYRFVAPGYSLRPLEMSGAIGLVQLEKLDDMLKVRRANAKHFLGHMSRIDTSKRVGFQRQYQCDESSWFGFAILLNNRRDYFVKGLIEKDIEVRPIVAGNFLRQPVMKYLNHKVSGTMLGADQIHDHGFFIGNDSVDITDKIDYFISVMRTYGYA